MKKLFSIFILTIFAGTDLYAGNSNMINAAAHTAQGVNITSTIANTAQGKSFTQKCSSVWVYCGMAVLAFVQAGLDLKNAADSGKTKSASNCTGAYCDGSSYTGGLDSPTGTGGTLGGTSDPLAVGSLSSDSEQGDVLGKIQSDINDQLKNLGDKGYSYDPATNSVNTPSNGSVSASTFASSDGLKSLGMSDGEISNIQKIAADALKSASKFAGSADYDSVGGGGGSKHRGHSDEDADGKAFDMNKYLAGLAGHKKDIRGVAGLEKNYGSDQIGVSQDNIFKMIHRRYEAKKTSLTP